MPTLKVAHIQEQGVDLIIVPLTPSFGQQPLAQQQRTIETLQMNATLAGLKGEVVPVWDVGGGKMGFVAPANYHPYFRSIGLDLVFANLNQEIYL